MSMVIDYVYSTDDYNVFKKLEGNRDVFEQRKKIISESIIANGWVRNPIVVNEKMQIIDGQGRFEACKSLGLPIEYVVAVGANINTCVALNVKQKNWAAMDYVECFSKIGNEHYKVLKKLIGIYSKMNFDSIVCLASAYVTPGGKIRNSIYEGRFEIFDEETLIERFNFAEKVLSFTDGVYGRQREWMSAIKFMFYSDCIDNERMLEKLNKYQAFLIPCVTTKQVLETFEKIYNYHSHEEKIYFLPEYEKYLKTKEK
ncbi:MAG: ParB N-terminal domain-containing protein [Clostridia bacterium]|nr:ParB N-terminal domain-containing protein [Clostridia bacterium]